MSEAPKQKEIDVKSGKIPASGKVFWITYSLSTTMYVEYLKRLPKLMYNTTFKSLYDTLSKIYLVNSSGNDMIYAVQQSRELAWNQLEAIKRFDENEIPDVIDFCALFLHESGADPSKFDLAVHQAKCLALHEEGYNIQGFFFFMGSLIEGFPEAYRMTQSQQGPAKQIDQEEANIQQTNLIS